ncbi:MAG: chemotaxis protein CheW [Peptostreptococcaceae bacterium]|nr:chemotaxis protein CheW [Peptostreptococcaceae bacterium]
MNLHSKNEASVDNAEIEIMEFMIGNEAFGIDVVNVREIMTVQEVTPAALSHPMVEGLFKPRDILYTVVALPSFIHNTIVENNPKDLFILTDYQGMNIAYRVNAVNGIVRVDRANIRQADRSVGGEHLRITKGIVTHEGRLISILDLHQIMSDIIPKDRQ